MLALDDLVDLGVALRRAGAKVSLPQLLATERLLLRLAAEDGLPASRLLLASWIAPVLCTNAAEQRAFDDLYARWLRERFEDTAASPPPAPTPSSATQAMPPAPREWRSVTIGIALAMTFAILAGVIGVRVYTSTDSGPAPTQTSAAAPASGAAASTIVPATGSGGLAFVQRFDFAASAPPPTLAERVLARNLAIVAAPLLLYALWMLRWLLLRPVLQRIASRAPRQFSEVHVPGSVRRLMPNLPLRRLAQELRRRRDVASNELQLEPTVHATLARHGNFTPVRGSRVEPDYLALIDREGLSDHQARLAAEIVDELSRSDVLIDRYDFTRDARIVRSRGSGVRQIVELSELQERAPNHFVLVFGDASGCLDPRTGEAAAWTHVLAGWSRCVLLTPLPVARWGRREWTLQRLGIEVLPLDAHGLHGLVGAMSGFATPSMSGQPSTRTGIPVFDDMRQRWLERDAPTTPTVDALVDGLRTELGARGLAWLASCAAYPEVHWGITLKLGAVLVPDPTSFEDLLPRIARLVWFREAYMPDWLRERLLAELSTRDERATRTALREMLKSAARGGDDVPLFIAQGEPAAQETWWRRVERWWKARGDERRAQEILRNAERDSPLRDHVFLRFLSGAHRRRIDLLAPLALLSSLTTGTSLQALLLGASAIVASIGLALSWPPVHLGQASESLAWLSFTADSRQLRMSAQVALEARGASPETQVRALGLALQPNPGGQGWSARNVSSGAKWEAVAPGGGSVVFERGGALFVRQGTTERALNDSPKVPVGSGQIAFSDDATALAVLQGRDASVWSLPDGKWRKSVSPAGTGQRRIAIDETGMHMALLVGGANATWWDLSVSLTGNMGNIELPVRGAGYDTIQISPDGRHVAASGKVGGILWDLSNPSRITPSRILATSPARVSFSSDSRSALISREISSAGVWDLATFRMTTLKDSVAQIDMASSPDGKRLAGVDAAGTLRLWDAVTGNLIGQPQRDAAPACCVAHVVFSPDGTLLARSMGTQLTLWRTDAAVPAPAAPELGAVPVVPQLANVAWMLVATILTALMVPGLAVFFGGVSARPGASAFVMRLSIVFTLVVVLWGAFGYSVAMTPGNAYFGGLDRAFLRGLFSPDPYGLVPTINTYERDVKLPAWLYALFTGTVAATGSSLLVVGLARMRLRPLLVFVAAWLVCTYIPLDHGFFWSGADAFADKAHVDQANGESGWLWRWNVLDGGGSLPTFLSAGIAGLVATLYRRQRRVEPPVDGHSGSAMDTSVGTGIVWVGALGWLGGYQLTLFASPVLVVFTALLAVASGAIAAVLCDALATRSLTPHAAAFGALSGMAAVGAAAANVGFAGAILVGAAGTFGSCGVQAMVRRLRPGNVPAVQFFAMIASASAIGAVVTGAMNSQALGGPGQVTDWTILTVGSTSVSGQLLTQVKGILAAAGWSAGVALAACVSIDLVWGWQAAMATSSDADETLRSSSSTADAGPRRWRWLGSVAFAACVVLGGTAVMDRIGAPPTSALLSELAAPQFLTPSAPTYGIAQAGAAQVPALAADSAASAASTPSTSTEIQRPGDIVWMLAAVMLLVLTASGTILFFAARARPSDRAAIGARTLLAFSLAIIVWYAFGYSLAFTEGNAYVGGLVRVFLSGLFDPKAGTFSNTATFAKGVLLPELLFVAYGGLVAAFACSLLAAAFGARVRTGRFMVFLVCWLTFAYCPLVHMTLYWNGPDAYTSVDVVDKLNASSGWIWQWGALDYAGGLSLGVAVPVAGLVCAWLSRPDAMQARMASEPPTGTAARFDLREGLFMHSPASGLAGMSLLWLAGYGLHGGAIFGYWDLAKLAAATNFVLPIAATIAWLGLDVLDGGRLSKGAIANGGFAGLVACMPAAGNVGLLGAVFMGLVAGAVGRMVTGWLARRRPGDDLPALFGGLAAAASAGVLLTGVLNNQGLAGPGLIADWVKMTDGSNGMVDQLLIQAKALAVTIAWSGITAFIAFRLIVGPPGSHGE